MDSNPKMIEAFKAKYSQPKPKPDEREYALKVIFLSLVDGTRDVHE